MSLIHEFRCSNECITSHSKNPQKRWIFSCTHTNKMHLLKNNNNLCTSYIHICLKGLYMHLWHTCTHTHKQKYLQTKVPSFVRIIKRRFFFRVYLLIFVHVRTRIWIFVKIFAYVYFPDNTPKNASIVFRRCILDFIFASFALIDVCVCVWIWCINAYTFDKKKRNKRVHTHTHMKRKISENDTFAIIQKMFCEVYLYVYIYMYSYIRNKKKLKRVCYVIFF